MKILLLGKNGFIGRQIAACLRRDGHELTMPSHRELDFLNLKRDQVMPLLAQQDAVVNAVGLMHRDNRVLETVHHNAPSQLAVWARESGVRCWLQLSALGADPNHSAAFLGSKGRGDAAVAASGLNVYTARPSLVFGSGGSSTQLFLRLAAFPVIPLPDGGKMLVQPVHINDVAAGMARLLTESVDTLPRTIEMGGNEILTFAAYLAHFRQAFRHYAAPYILPLPVRLLKVVAKPAAFLTNGMLSRDSLDMLCQGSVVADNRPFAELLGRVPLGVHQFDGV